MIERLQSIKGLRVNIQHPRKAMQALQITPQRDANLRAVVVWVGGGGDETHGYLSMAAQSLGQC
jgi:hypothetical protein